MIQILSFICLLILISPAHAGEDKKADVKIPTADFTELKHTKSGRIDKVIDGLTVVLKDGTIVRLASINTPDFHIWENAPFSEAALKLLNEKLPEQTEIMLYQTRDRKKGRTNRMNHQLAQLVTKKDKLWIQGLLLANGLAYVYTAPNATDMLNQMYQVEQTARQNHRGMWTKESDHLILTPEDTPSHIGDFAIIEGTVQEIATIRNMIYLNFGKNWKTDFTIMIPPALRKKFSHQGINLLALTQKPVRVRGYLREYNGPLIELEDPAHLELLQNPSKEPNLPEAPPIKAKRIHGSQ